MISSLDGLGAIAILAVAAVYGAMEGRVVWYGLGRGRRQ